MKVLLTSFILSVSIFYSCKITFVPQRNADLIAQIEVTAQQTDRLYFDIQNSNDKHFSSYESQYNQIQSDINSILLKQVVRQHSDKLVQLTTIVSDNFKKYAEEHKNKDTLTNGQAESYQKDMQAFWKSLLVAESSLK